MDKSNIKQNKDIFDEINTDEKKFLELLDEISTSPDFIKDINEAKRIRQDRKLAEKEEIKMNYELSINKLSSILYMYVVEYGLEDEEVLDVIEHMNNNTDVVVDIIVDTEEE